MRAPSWAVAVWCVLAVGAGAQLADALAAADPPAGVWKGTWEGGGSSGAFDIRFEQDGDGKLTGSVAVGTELGNYTAKFSSLVFTGGNLDAAYEYPPDPMGEVTLKGKFDNASATGTWSLAGKAQPGQAFANGTWTVNKQ